MFYLRRKQEGNAGGISKVIATTGGSFPCDSIQCMFVVFISSGQTTPAVITQLRNSFVRHRPEKTINIYLTAILKVIIHKDDIEKRIIHISQNIQDLNNLLTELEKY